MDTSILEYLSFCFLALGVLALISAIWYFFKHKIRTVYAELKYGEYLLDENTNTYSADFEQPAIYSGKNSYAELVPDSADSSRLEKIKESPIFGKNYEKGGTEAFNSDLQNNAAEIAFTDRGVSPQPKYAERVSFKPNTANLKGHQERDVHSAATHQEPRTRNNPIFTVDEDIPEESTQAWGDELTVPLDRLGDEPLASDHEELTVPLDLDEEELTVPLSDLNIQPDDSEKATMLEAESLPLVCPSRGEDDHPRGDALESEEEPLASDHNEQTSFL